MRRSKRSELARGAGVVGLAVALAVGTGAAVQGAEFFIPYFPAAGSGDSPAPRGEIRIVNRSASSTTALITGKDEAGNAGDGTAAAAGWTTESIPAGGNIRVTDVQLEDASRLGNGAGVWSLEVVVAEGVHVIPFRVNQGGGSPELVPLPVRKVTDDGLRVSQITLFRYFQRNSNRAGDVSYPRVLWAYLRHPQSDLWDDCDVIVMRPGSTGAFMTVREASWTGADAKGPTPADGLADGDPYIRVLTDSDSLSHQTPDMRAGETTEQVRRHFYLRNIRDFRAGADTTLYQVRARCSRTVDGVKTSSPVVRRCYRLHSTATCPAA